MFEFAITRNVSIGNLTMQLDFLIEELKTSFPKVFEGLTKATSVKEASNLVLLEFEKPLDQSFAVQAQRENYGLKFYQEYAKNKPAATVAKKTYPLNIINAFGTTNTEYKANRNPQWIVIHYTAGTSSKMGSALNLAMCCKNGGLNSSAEFYVDDGSVVQYIQDIRNRYSWSVGGKKYPSMSTSLGGLYHGICTNQNSINIEVCNEKTNKKSLLTTDTDWYYTDAAIDNAVALTKYLMKQYNIGIDHVIMHHHVTGKPCPAMWTRNEDCLKGWYDFLEKVKNAEVEYKEPSTTVKSIGVPAPASSTFEPYLIQIAVSALNVRDGAGVNYKVNTIIRDKNSYTIVEEKNGWGKLKSGAGWINLSYTKRV